MGMRAVENDLTPKTQYFFSEPPQRGGVSIEAACRPQEYRATSEGGFDGLMFAFCLFVVLFLIALIRALLA